MFNKILLKIQEKLIQKYQMLDHSRWAAVKGRTNRIKNGTKYNFLREMIKAYKINELNLN